MIASSVKTGNWCFDEKIDCSNFGGGCLSIVIVGNAAASDRSDVLVVVDACIRLHKAAEAYEAEASKRDTMASLTEFRDLPPVQVLAAMINAWPNKYMTAERCMEIKTFPSVLNALAGHSGDVAGKSTGAKTPDQFINKDNQ